VEEYGERYCLIGPFMVNAAAVEFEELAPPKPLSEALKKMQSQGVVLHFGRWLVPGNPHCLLFELGSSWTRLDAWRGYCAADLCFDSSFFLTVPRASEYLERAGIRCDPLDKETNDALVFGFLVAWFLREVQVEIGTRKIIAHYHEVGCVMMILWGVFVLTTVAQWMAAVGLTMLKAWGVPVTSIFTTHATLIGRYLCAGQADFYHTMQSVDADAEAGRRGIFNRHSMEKRAAHDAVVFTTVSDITAEVRPRVCAVPHAILY
jgi:glycogen(starch) synthase